MKISIITITLNNHNGLKGTIESVLSQNFENLEYIIIDGGSTDGSLELIKSFGSKVDYLISENDTGIYNAINKGIKIANGDIIGLLHSGDVFFDSSVLSRVHSSFTNDEIQIIYGHSLVFNDSRVQIVRKNISPKFKDNLMRLGWFPSHQATYYKANIFSKYGLYDETYKIAADYEFFLRMLYVHDLRPVMVDFFVIKFYLGGKSSKNIISVFKSNLECYKAWKKNNLRIPMYTIPLKLFRKFSQKLMYLINE